ncbi:MAG: META domain-containing protein, partial [Desulfuromonas sp.]
VLASAYVLERVRGIEVQDINAAVGLLADIHWELVELDGVSLSTTQVGIAWLVFKRESQRVYGSAGCNRLTGSWVAGDDAVAQQGQQDTHAAVPLPLHLGPLGTTMMACPAELMQLEDSFLSALATVSGVYLDGEGLILTDNSGQKVARFAARNAQ